MVLGAGLAGLSAALELAKSGCFSRIVVLEKSGEVGGNVRSRRVRVWNDRTRSHDEKWVDFGALQVWKWYVSFLDVAKQMNMEHLFVPMNRPPVLLESRRKSSHRQPCDYRPFEMSSIVGVWDLSRLLKMPDEAFDPYDHRAHKMVPSSAATSPPTTDRFARALSPKTSLADLFPPEEKRGGNLATYYESYTYGSTSEAPAYLWLPMAARSGQEYSAEGKTQFLPWKMESVLRELYGCEFVFQASATRVDAGAKTVDFRIGGSSPESRDRRISYDVLITTAPMGTVEFTHLPELEVERVGKVRVDSDRPEYRYTSYAAACVRMSSVPQSPPWSACFAVPRDDQPLQIRSWVNLDGVAKVTDRVLFYVHGRTARDLSDLTDARVQDLVRGVCFFRGCEPVKVDRIEMFPHTMPVFNESFLRSVDRAQGRGDVWFAGHYMATFPSMELATYTGRMAAFQAIERRRCRPRPNVSNAAESLQRQVQRETKALTQEFKRNIQTTEATLATGLAVGFGAFFALLAATFFSVSEGAEKRSTKSP